MRLWGFISVVRQSLQGFVSDESAATAIEYALMASLIAVVISASVVALSGSVLSMWEMIADKLAEVM